VGVILFFLTLSAADSIGFVPDYLDSDESGGNLSLADLPELGEEIITSQNGVLPSRIIISAIGLDLPVSNPETRDIQALDTILQKGPARYVDSALLGESGNVLIFGHSSHLPVVHNQMYKAFNRVPDLKSGDSIIVQGGGKEFAYRVLSVKSMNAEDGVIDLAKSGNRLTIVTCDTLTSKSARFVVEAELVGSYEL
jgi:LPXTG-site transpeptidase (sortase) family protein